MGKVRNEDIGMSVIRRVNKFYQVLSADMDEMKVIFWVPFDHDDNAKIAELNRYIKDIENSPIKPDYLKKKLSKNDLSIAVGYDSRVSSPRIAKTVCKTLSTLGVKVYDCGLSSTPSMFMSVVNFGVDSAVEVTASHLPMEMNGLKFFTREGGFSGEDIKVIL